ncbi:MAG: ABC transporter ATP-binding protein [Candidatus Methanomethylicota archaeon]|uniref:ABC transporter ATP-binding protein n=1 Tax=Thermoproteota archaeon TaxID=2056631 RepID=A0A497F4X3_9CREN|nr:MAG: ABC transporter ATP-binding protein [Candidatus Verstraetearchaeota archaeon]
MTLLKVDGLKTYYFTLRGPVKAVDNVSFEVESGEALGLAGESGCGKTTAALSIIRLVPPPGKIVDGKLLFNGVNLLELSKDDMRKIRWKEIAIIFQGAMNALNPVMRVGDQIAEAILVHEPDIDKKEAFERAGKLLQLVGIDPSRAKDYPHEFSGGMRQRAMIAMALACNPKLLIADEPATALDVIVQAQVLDLLKDLREKLGLSMILITHDLSIIAETCDRVAIMYAGKIVEYADVRTIFKHPLHPYTKGLIDAFPNIKGPRKPITSIPGSPPNLLNPPPGCRFHPRCKYAKDICKKEEPPLLCVDEKHYVACHLAR